MPTNRIEISVELNEEKVPQSISWSAQTGEEEKINRAKAMMLSFWDGEDRTTMRLDLWTEEMMVDEMTDFFYQTLVTMADTYKKSTHSEEQAQDLSRFARQFREKFLEKEKAAQGIAGK
ncbi:MAG TPA: gliding motility protein GldC [Chitinophagaceae bacterium]|nr:gliding motility protein GldC [Chitinophagaceae bacterium]